MRKALTTDVAVAKATCDPDKRVTRYSCGGLGLYLDVKPTGKRAFVLRVMVNRKAIERGLGSYPVVGLAEAREKAIKFTRELQDGQAVGARAATKAQPNVITFKDAAAHFLAKQDKDGAFKPALDGGPSVHRKQWDYTLDAFVFPHIGDMNVDDIRIASLTPIFETLWKEKNATASKTRGRIAAIIDHAVDKGWRDEDRSNPARHKSSSFKKPKGKKTRHHPSIPYQEMPAFMHQLRSLDSVSASALEFAILTGVRTTECRAAKWSEIDFATREWLIPAMRMKADASHCVPLSNRAIAVLEKLMPLRGPSDYIFPSNATASCLSRAAMYACLKGLRPDATVHGFRTTIRGWAISAGVPEEIRKSLNAHTEKDKVKKAYERGAFFDERVPIMQEWADYLSGKA